MLLAWAEQPPQFFLFGSSGFCLAWYEFRNSLHFSPLRICVINTIHEYFRMMILDSQENDTERHIWHES